MSEPASSPPKRKPSKREQKRTQRRKHLIAEVKRFVKLFNRLPTRADWRPEEVGKSHGPRLSTARAAEINEVQQHGPWPEHKAPERLFGSWTAMIEAAGYAPRAAQAVTSAEASYLIRRAARIIKDSDATRHKGLQRQVLAKLREANDLTTQLIAIERRPVRESKA